MKNQVTADRLASIPLFADVPRDKLAEVAAAVRTLKAPTGHVLAEEGDFSSLFFVILDGYVTVHRAGRHIADLGKDDFFGEAGTMTCAPRNATVIATTPVDAVVFMGWDLRDLCEELPSLKARLEAVSAERAVQA